jgi:hypothetical protein
MRGAALLATSFIAASAFAQSPRADPLARIGAYVESYYSRAQRIVTEESVVVQPLGRDLTAEGFPRRASYEVRVEWEPGAATPEERARIVRQLLKSAGPLLFDRGEEKCADPPSVTPEPLAFLLPGNQSDWTFTMGKRGTLDGRAAISVDYRRRSPRPPSVAEDGDCLLADLSGLMVGRLWADAASAEVLRVEERLARSVDLKVPKEMLRRNRPTHANYEQLLISTRYKTVAFTEPEETLLLPASIESLHVYKTDAGTNRLRITQTFTKYRRFVTASRLLP